MNTAMNLYTPSKTSTVNPATLIKSNNEESTVEVLVQKIGTFRYAITVKNNEVYFSRI